MDPDPKECKSISANSSQADNWHSFPKSGASVYSGLELKDDEIRLLSIAPAASNAEIISCSLQTVSLSDWTPLYGEVRSAVKHADIKSAANDSPATYLAYWRLASRLVDQNVVDHAVVSTAITQINWKDEIQATRGIQTG
jgi:hypothetical protein